MSLMKNKQLYGKIRPSQRWRKKDSGQIMTVISRQAPDSWRVAFDSRTIKASHKIREHVIYQFYEKL